MRILSWNVNGIRAIAGKGFADWLRGSGADVVLLQETKAKPEQVPDELQDFEGRILRVHAAERPGYSGVAIYARTEPDEWITGVGDSTYDVEGRALFARFGDLVVGSAYFPNSQAKGVRIEYRLGYGAAMRAFLDRQRELGRHVVLGGDYNVAHEEIDLARPKQNVDNPGFLPAEREWMSGFLEGGYVDTWRRCHPGEVGYSWWSYRGGSRARNVGWRLDYLCVDEDLWPRVRAADIQADVHGSDHCPVGLDLAE